MHGASARLFYQNALRGCPLWAKSGQSRRAIFDILSYVEGLPIAHWNRFQVQVLSNNEVLQCQSVEWSGVRQTTVRNAGVLFE